MHSNLARRGIDHPQAGAGLTSGEQLLGGFHHQRQARRSLGDGAGVRAGGARVIAPGTGEQGQTAGRPGRRSELVGAKIAEPRLLKVPASVGPDGVHELAPPPVRCAVEYRAPPVRDRWHQTIGTGGVLVNLARASQGHEVAEAVRAGLSERDARQDVGILSAYGEFYSAGAGAGRHLLWRGIGDLGLPPAMPFVEVLIANRPGHQLGDLGERVRPRAVYGLRRRFDRRVGLCPADLGVPLQPQVLELSRAQTGLDFEVATAWPAQPLLPAPAAGG